MILVKADAIPDTTLAKVDFTTGTTMNELIEELKNTINQLPEGAELNCNIDVTAQNGINRKITLPDESGLIINQLANDLIALNVPDETYVNLDAELGEETKTKK